MTECRARSHDRTTYAQGSCRCDTGRNDRRIYLKRRREGRAVLVRIPALGYQRRIHALIASGWSYRRIGVAAGMAHQEIRRVSLVSQWVSRATATRLDQAWATLSEDDGGSIRSIKLGRIMDWAPTWAWDGRDIDDPRARPQLHAEPIIDEVLIQRVLDGKRSYRDLNPDERLGAYRAAIAAGWSVNRMQEVFHVSGSVVSGLKRAA